MESAREYNLLRSRAPGHGEDLIRWCDAFMASSHIEETAEEIRLRHAACLFGDIGWRTSPDYRSDLALNLLANSPMVGVDHPGRAFSAWPWPIAIWARARTSARRSAASPRRA